MCSNNINNFDIYKSIEYLNYKNIERYLQSRYKYASGEAYWFMLESIYEDSNHLYKECKKCAKILLKFYKRPSTFESKLLKTMDCYKERKKEAIRMIALESLSLCMNRYDNGKIINSDILGLIKEYL